MRRAECWAPGCDCPLAWVDGWWACPKGCALRDMGRWTRQHIVAMDRTPGQVARYFGDAL